VEQEVKAAVDSAIKREEDRYKQKLLIELKIRRDKESEQMEVHRLALKKKRE